MSEIDWKARAEEAERRWDEASRAGWVPAADLAAMTKRAEEAERSRDTWRETAAQEGANRDFYRGLVRQIGERFGKPAFVSDDGSVQDSVLALKVPELVSGALADLDAARAEVERLLAFWDDTEPRSAEAHDVYQVEAHRRGDVRHPDAYADLSEATKEWDRVLVRWVARACRAALAGPKEGA